MERDGVKILKNMEVYIGEFGIEAVMKGVDKEVIKLAQERPALKQNGIKYIKSEMIKKNGKIIAIKVWLTDRM